MAQYDKFPYRTQSRMAAINSLLVFQGFQPAPAWNGWLRGAKTRICGRGAGAKTKRKRAVERRVGKEFA
ncbi:MAG: hypothetical protein II098_04915 [Treponema sp.]|nr:hypothetical protein [Treponema sp.]